jgi:hypothetical protein
MKIRYIDKNFYKKTEALISVANSIIEEYAGQGFDLTLRQLYYQLVARDHIPNSQKEYKKLSVVISDARMAGLIDWDAIVDRTRIVNEETHWDDPQEILENTYHSYCIDKWQNQPYRPEVWIEKDALTGVIAPTCEALDIPYTAIRGYHSQSGMWRAGHYRLTEHIKKGQVPYIIHLGDHDPSGLDMTRDVRARLELFAGTKIKVDRLALNFGQVQDYNPPPNPAKISDPRAKGYLSKFGRASWELDALEPSVISELIRDTILGIRDHALWQDMIEKELAEKETLKNLKDNLNGH